jgi:hypothetical protein
MPRFCIGVVWLCIILLYCNNPVFSVGHPMVEKWPTLAYLPCWQNDQQHIQGHK